MIKRALLPALVFLLILSGILYAAQQPKIIPYSTSEYAKFVSIEDLYGGRGNVGETTGMPIVWFKIRNTGEYTLDRVQVTVEFLDKHNNVVFEKKLHPVHQGVESGAPVKPLEPGEVWQMSAIRYYIIQRVPHTWELGNIRASITDLDFQT